MEFVMKYSTNLKTVEIGDCFKAVECQWRLELCTTPSPFQEVPIKPVAVMNGQSKSVSWTFPKQSKPVFAKSFSQRYVPLAC